MSRLGFAEVARLKADHLETCDASGALQANQHLLDSVKFYVVVRKARDVVGQPIGGGGAVRHVVLLG
jgi:hypothetical protein